MVRFLFFFSLLIPDCTGDGDDDDDENDDGADLHLFGREGDVKAMPSMLDPRKCEILRAKHSKEKRKQQRERKLVLLQCTKHF